MEIVSAILGVLTLLLGGLNLFQFISFRATKKRYEAEALAAAADSAEKTQSAMERRLKAVEAAYIEQGKELDKLRKELLDLSTKKFEDEKRIVQLESENKTLKQKVDQMGEQLKAYKIINKQ